MAFSSWTKIQFLQQKGPEHLLKKLDHIGQGRDNVCPLLLKHLDHTNQERGSRVTHEEDFEPFLAETESDSSDDGVAMPEKLCDDDESDKSSEVSKEDDEEEEEKEDDEEEE
jgi:hypothetical protein